MRPNLKYGLRLKRDLRQLEKEIQSTELDKVDGLDILQALARNHQLAEDRRTIKKLMQNMCRNLGFQWW